MKKPRMTKIPLFSALRFTYRLIGSPKISSKLIGKALIFAIGIILGFALDKLLDGFFVYSKEEPSVLYFRVSLFISGLLLVFFIVNMGYLEAVTTVLNNVKGFSVKISQDEYFDGSMSSVKRIAFRECSDIVSRATKSIIVIGPHFGGDASLDDEDDERKVFTESHDRYLSDSLTKAVLANMLSKTSDFTYIRIVQISHSVARNLETGNRNKLSREAFGNNTLADHVHEVLRMRVNHQRGMVDIKALPHVPSFPSILIVDDRYIFFSLPTDPTGVSGRDLAHDTVISIDDAEGSIAKTLKSKILNFSRDAFSISLKNLHN